MSTPLTGDEERFLRVVRILLDDVPHNLRATFKAKFHALFHFAWDDTRTFGEFFVANFGSTRTPPHITDVIKQGNTENFDSTALFTCLLFSGTDILVPKPRRGTRTLPLYDSERIDELREMRNALAHAISASLTQTEFNQKLASLNTIYAQLLWNPTVMRQWAQDPVVTAESVRLQQLLDVERQRYISLDGTVQVLTQTVQGTDRRVEEFTGTVQELVDDVSQLKVKVQQQEPVTVQRRTQSGHSDARTDLHRHPGPVQTASQHATDELETWRKRLKEEQRRMLKRCVVQRNEEENTSLKDLADMFVDLRMHKKSDNYKRIERRVHYDLLQLKLEIDTCSPITVNDLFEGEPGRTLVHGAAGIGKSLLCFHILDMWLRNELLPDVIGQVFLFKMRDLFSVQSLCSLADLFFKYQRGGFLSHDAASDFFYQMQSNPSKFLIIFDGLDEASVMPSENKAFAYDEKVEMPRLIASILNGNTLPSVRLLVTSRPGGVINCDGYDKNAVVYGFTREKMHEYIVKFTGGNDTEKKAIGDYIDNNVNIRSFCYIPVHLNIVCRMVKMQMRDERSQQLPETLTELLVCSVGNLLANHHPEFKDTKAKHNPEQVITTLKDPVLDHAKLACYGMEKVPIAVTFTESEISEFHLKETATKCGLLSESMESSVVMSTPIFTPVHYFQHLTLQEFLAAVELVTNVKRLQGMLTTSSRRQLDLVLIFVAGLVGNSRNQPFLRALYETTSRWWNPFQRSFAQTNATALKQLMKSVVKRERTIEANTFHNSAVHKSSTMLLVTMINESRQRELWRLVSDYVLEGGTKLDLSGQHLSPTEQHALAYVLPQTQLTSLMLNGCGLSWSGTEKVIAAASHLPALEELSLRNNPGLLHGVSLSSLGELTALKTLQLSLCGLDDSDMDGLVAAVSSMTYLEVLRLADNDIGDDAAVRVTSLATDLPHMQQLALHNNWVTEAGVDRMKEAARDTPRLWLPLVDFQRRPGQPQYTDDVQSLQRRLVDLETALDRARTRRPESWWDEDMRWQIDKVQLQQVIVERQVQRLTITMQREAEPESH